MVRKISLCVTNSFYIRLCGDFVILKWEWYVARMGGRRGVYRDLVGKPDGNSSLWRPRPRWEDNIRMDLQGVGCGGVDWIELA